MSHRFLPQRTARTLLSCTKVRYHAPLSIFPSILPPSRKYLRDGTSPLQTRSATYVAKARRSKYNSRNMSREDPMNGEEILLDDVSYTALKDAGFNRKQADTLHHLVESRCRNFRDVRYVHESLRHRSRFIHYSPFVSLFLISWNTWLVCRSVCFLYATCYLHDVEHGISLPF